MLNNSFEGSYDILHAKYMDSVCNFRILKIVNLENFSESVDLVETEKHWCQKLTFQSQ